MKRYIYSICAVAAIVFAASCAKEQEVNGTTETKVFTARIESTKTTIDENDKQYWETGDEISINGTTYVASTVEGATAVFTKKSMDAPEPMPIDGKYNASFPANLFDNVTGEASFPENQIYGGTAELSGVNPLYGEGSAAGNDMLFHNIGGMLELKLDGAGTVGSIEVNDGNTGLSGEFTLAEDYAAVLTDEAKAAKAGVTLDCGEGVTLSESASIFHIAVPAGEYTALSIKVKDIDGNEFVAKMKEGITAAVGRSTVNPISLTVKFTESECLGGIFTVAEGRTVQFTKANASYDGGAWKIGENQYSDAGAKALFFWTNDSSNSYGSSESYVATSASELDWGKAFTGESLTTLSSAEWDYLLNTRTMTGGKPRYSNAVATPVSIDGKVCKGLFIYPDDYSGSIVDGTFSWEEIDAAGIAFLPASGRRNGTAVSYSGSNGYYWAKDAFNSGTAYYMGFSLNGVKTNVVFGRYMGYSVRLVKVVE